MTEVTDGMRRLGLSLRWALQGLRSAGLLVLAADLFNTAGKAVAVLVAPARLRSRIAPGLPVPERPLQGVWADV